MAVREQLAALRDHATVPLDRSNMVVVAEVNVMTEDSMEVARTPPVHRKPIDNERWQDLHGEESARERVERTSAELPISLTLSALQIMIASPRRSGQSERVPVAVCAHWGRPTEEHNRHLRFVLPEPVLAVPKEDRAGRTWGNEVLMMVQEVGAFVRVLVPIHLTGGYTVTFGAWLGVHPDDLRRTREIWFKPEYAEMELDGVLANMLPPWEEQTYRHPLRVAVRNPDEVPYAVNSSDADLQRILTEEWPHEFVLAAVAPFE